MYTTITLVRHGETEWNIVTRLQGHSDSNLTQTGASQVVAVSEKLKNYHIDGLYTSDLQRAITTAKSINKHHHLTIKYSEMIRERSFGVMEGLTLKEIQAKYPETYKNYLSRVKELPIEKGESLLAFYERTTKELNRIVEENRGMKILVVCHGGTIDCITRKVFDYPLDARRCFQIPNTGINTFIVDSNNEWTVKEFGNIDHLNEINAQNEWN